MPNAFVRKYAKSPPTWNPAPPSETSPAVKPSMVTWFCGVEGLDVCVYRTSWTMVALYRKNDGPPMNRSSVRVSRSGVQATNTCVARSRRSSLPCVTPVALAAALRKIGSGTVVARSAEFS